MNDPSQMKDALTSIFDALTKNSAEGFNAVRDVPLIKKAFELAQKGCYEEFFFALQYPFDELVDALVDAAVPHGQEAKFLMKNSQFIEAQFEKIIEKNEGSACCADKSRFIMRSLFNYFTTGKEIELNRAQEYTYHLPKKVFTTHEQIVGFFDGVMRLYYGQYEPYIKALSVVLDSAKTSAENTSEPVKKSGTTGPN